jgi:hypothetical protein
VPPAPEPRAPNTAVLWRALLYAGALTLLVLYAPDGGPRFIYVGF